ncbi:MAG: hypothetical protein ACRD68_17065, partial [Pyrinomonadaceae bacterium]
MPLMSMVRALCRAATTGSDVLYDVMLKLSLMVDATAQTYGLATFAQKGGEQPRLKWVEGLDQEEIAEAESRIAAAFSDKEGSLEMRAGDRSICLLLATATPQREGAAIYGRCVRPLTHQQATELRLLSDVAQLAHAHASLREELHQPVREAAHASVASATLPGMVFVSRAMSDLARDIERVKD